MENNNGFQESIDTFTVIFGCREEKQHSIDAELFTKIINETIELVKVAATTIEPNSFLRLEIRANKEGSFQTIIDAIVKCHSSLFTPESASYAFNVVQGFCNFLQIKEHLKGKKAKKIEKKENTATITNQENETGTFPLSITEEFFKNAKLDNCVINIFEKLNEYNKPTFSIEHREGKINFEQGEQYDYMIEKVIDGKNAISHVKKQPPCDVKLLLKKPDLLGDSAWQFIYNKVISAKIEDREFLRKVHSGEEKRLYAGVEIPCRLQIEYELDELFNPIPNTDRYFILEVTGEIIEPVKDSLFDNKE